MTDEPDTTDLLNLWQDQPTEISPMLLADVHKRALRFQSHQKLMLIIIGFGVATTVVMSGFAIFRFDDGFFRLGYLVLTLGMLFVLYYRHSRRITNPSALASASRDCFDFYRQSLVKRIRLLRTVSLWGHLPILPGAALILWSASRLMDRQMASALHLHPEKAARIAHNTAVAHNLIAGAIVILLAAIGFELIWVWMRLRKLKRELAVLEG